VKVEIVMGFIFINPDLTAESLSAQIAPGVKRFKAHHADIENYRLAQQVTFDIAANWKNVGDNLLECYHCHPAHKAFVDLVNMDSYVVESNGIWSWQGGTCRAQNAAYRLPDGLSDYEREFVTFYIWPDIAFTLFPGSNIMATFLFAATGPESTHQVFSIYSPDGKLDSVAHRIVDYFRDVLGPEDVDLVENVQKGLHSMSYERGRFMVDSARSYFSEHAVHHLHNLVVHYMKQDD
jgi:choline monooxygenase